LQVTSLDKSTFIDMEIRNKKTQQNHVKKKTSTAEHPTINKPLAIKLSHKRQQDEQDIRVIAKQGTTHESKYFDT